MTCVSATMGSEPPAFAAGNRPSNLPPAWHRAVIACVAALRCFEQSWTGCSEEKRYAGEQNKQNYCKNQMRSGRPRRGPATRQCAAQTESVATLRQSARGLAATRTGGNRWNKRENRDSASLGAGHPARGEPASDVCSICELVMRFGSNARGASKLFFFCQSRDRSVRDTVQDGVERRCRRGRSAKRAQHRGKTWGGGCRSCTLPGTRLGSTLASQAAKLEAGLRNSGIHWLGLSSFASTAEGSQDCSLRFVPIVEA